MVVKDYIYISYGLKNVYNILPDFEILGGQFQWNHKAQKTEIKP